MPKRIQRKRTKGWRLPAGAVCVDRSTRWGNPFAVGTTRPHPLEHLGPVEVRDQHHAMVLFDNWLLTTPEGRRMATQAKAELRGKDLACFCAEGTPCHGDVLIRVANAELSTTKKDASN